MVRERAERGAEETPSQPPAGLSIAEIRQLIGLMETSNISEISVEREGEGLKLLLRRLAPASEALLPEGDEEGYLDEASLDGERNRGGEEIGSPLVGVFRSSMNGDRPLVSPGDKVRKGQIIAAIEALNLLSEVEAPVAGRISEILVLDGQAVEYGQPLLVIDPS
ncbi:MAG: acetyl-CoA carboxylase biotin carboxyl carrier protein [Ktedonobacterales bacterium]